MFCRGRFARSATFIERDGIRTVKTKWKLAATSFLMAMAVALSAANLRAQEGRKALTNPEPPYPEVAKRLRLSGVVKVQVVIATDGKIKDVKVVGGHPIFVNSVEETLKSWKFAPSATETTTTLEFTFKP
jgi:TonB family protein